MERLIDICKSSQSGINIWFIINGIRPSKILPSYDTKPWEIKAIDTKEIWQYGSYTSIGSLYLLMWHHPALRYLFLH